MLMLFESTPSTNKVVTIELDKGQTMSDCWRKANFFRNKAKDNPYLDISAQCFGAEVGGRFNG